MIMRIIKKLFKVRFTKDDIEKEVERLAYVVVSVEPVRSLSKLRDGNLPKELISSLNLMCEDIAKIHSHTLQKNYFFKCYLELKAEIKLNSKIRATDSELKFLWYNALGQEDAVINSNLNSELTTESLLELEGEKRISALDGLLVARFVHLLAQQTIMAMISPLLFNDTLDDDKYDIVRRHDLLIDQSMKKTLAELFLIQANSVPSLKKIYNFNEPKRRSALLTRFYNSVAAGDNKEIDVICDEFVDNLKENYNAFSSAL